MRVDIDRRGSGGDEEQGWKIFDAGGDDLTQEGTNFDIREDDFDKKGYDLIQEGTILIKEGMNLDTGADEF